MRIAPIGGRGPSTSMSVKEVPSLPSFPLFADPAREDMFVASGEPCDICHQFRGTLYIFKCQTCSALRGSWDCD
jgi:hypothetical protein